MYSSRKLVIFLTLIALLAIAACTSDDEEESKATAVPTQETIVITASGSGTVTLILETIEEAFEADTPNYNLEVLSGSGTGGGIEGVFTDVLDIAAMARPPEADETEQGLQYFKIGFAGDAIYTHPDVGVTALSKEQISGIFSGEITNWSEVGGEDADIILFLRNDDDSSTQSLRSSIIGETPFPETAAQVLTSQNDMQMAVSGTPNSIGYGTWPSAVASGAKVSPIEIDGELPSSPDYSIKKEIGLGYVEADSERVQPLLDWLLSDKGQAALQNLDLIIG